MAVLTNHPPCPPSLKYSLFLRLLFLMMVVIACPAWEQVFADQPFSQQVISDFDVDEEVASPGLQEPVNTPVVDPVPEVSEHNTDCNSLDEDGDTTDINEESDEDETGTNDTIHSFCSPQDDLTCDASEQEAYSATIGADGVSTGIPLTLIQPTGTTIGISQTIVSQDADGIGDESSIIVSEERIPFTIEPGTLSGASLHRETESAYHTRSLSSEDKSVVYQARGTTEEVTLPEVKTLRAPVVRFVVSTTKDSRTGYPKEVISLEENRLQLDEHGKRGVLIDASALPASYQRSAILQLSLRYRRHCGIEAGEWKSTFHVSDSINSVVSHMVYQESSVKPFSASRNLYLLQVDLCEKRKGQVFSLYFSKEKNIRSMVSKFGSIASYIIAAKIAGQFVAERTDQHGQPYKIPDGDNSGFTDKVASALPAGAVFNGIGYLREEIERWNLSGYESDISACVTSGLMIAAMNVADSDFTSDTSQMFVSNAGRLYSRSAFFGELYSCFKTSIVDRLAYGTTDNHNVTDARSEQISFTTASVLSALFMYSYDFIDSAEMKIMQQHEINDKKGLNKLERTQLGNIARGGAASVPYKIMDTVDQHYIQNADNWNIALDNSWRYFFAQAGIQAIFWMAAITTLHYSRPYELRQGPALGMQLLNTRSIFGANLIEAGVAHGFALLDRHVSRPVAGYLADRAASHNLTVPDSALYNGIKTTIRFTINAGTAYFGIRAINYAGETGKNYFYPMANDPTTMSMPLLTRKYAENNRFFLDIVTGTATNGVVLPLVLSLDEDVFTPISDGASYFLCSPRGWGVGCPTRELQIGIVVDKSGSLAADTHELQLVTSD